MLKAGEPEARLWSSLPNREPVAIKILAQWCRSRHDEPPGFAMLNLTRLHLGIAHESQFQGLGISPAKLSNLGGFDTSSSRFVPRACTHKSAPCKRGSVTVRFAPKATELLRCRKTSLCANSGLLERSKLFARDHLRKNRCTTPKAGLESVAEVVDIYQQATRRQR